MIVINVEASGSVEAFQDVLQKTLQPHVKSLLILACDANNFSPESINPILASSPVPVMGGIFPGVISGRSTLMKGTIVVGLPTPVDIHIIPGLSDQSLDYETVIDAKFPQLGHNRTMFVFVDAFAPRIGALIESLFNIFGLDVNYIGGGAGSLSFHEKPCLMTRQGLVGDCAVLGLTELDGGVGVSHGWSSIAGPFRVTESQGNAFVTLDWEPAFSIYQKVVENAQGRPIDCNDFYRSSQVFPFGINRLGAEKVVREIVRFRDDGALVTVGDVPHDAYVDILSGDRQSVVAAARKALDISKGSLRIPDSPKVAMLFDCISRALFLGEAFAAELDAVMQEDVPLFGALTLGEIANSGRDYLEFYNKTIVVGLFEDA